MFKWNESYSVNIPVIDEQHKKLFLIGKSIVDQINKHEIDYDHTLSLILQMVDYTKYHFDTEEEMMKSYNYEGLEEHIKEHNRFVDYIDSLSFIDFQEDHFELLSDIMEFLTNWIFKHIQVTDKEFCDFVIERKNNRD